MPADKNLVAFAERGDVRGGAAERVVRGLGRERGGINGGKVLGDGGRLGQGVDDRGVAQLVVEHVEPDAKVAAEVSVAGLLGPRGAAVGGVDKERGGEEAVAAAAAPLVAMTL